MTAQDFRLLEGGPGAPGELTLEAARRNVPPTKVQLSEGLAAYVGDVPAKAAVSWSQASGAAALGRVTFELVALALRTADDRPFFPTAHESAEALREAAELVSSWPKRRVEELADAAYTRNGAGEGDTAGNSGRGPSSSSPAA